MYSKKYNSDEFILNKWKPLLQDHMKLYLPNKIFLLLGRFAERNVNSNTTLFVELVNEYRNVCIVNDFQHNLQLYYMIFEPKSIEARQYKINKILNE